MEKHRIETVLETNMVIGRIIFHHSIGAWRINDDDDRAQSSIVTRIMVSAKVIAWKRCMMMVPDLTTMSPKLQLQKFRTMLVDTILECNMTLCHDRTFWLRLLQGRPLRNSIYPLIRDRASHIILADRDVMIAAAKHVKQIVQFVDSTLWMDRSFMEHVLFRLQQRRTHVLKCVPAAAQRQWPRLIARFATVPKPARPWRHIVMTSAVTHDLWLNREFVLSWLEHNNPIVKQFSFVEKWRRDKDIFLAIQNFDDPKQIRTVFPSLINDRDFMLQAVTANVLVYNVVSDRLKEDFAIAQSSLLGNPDNISVVPVPLLSNREFMMQALKRSRGSSVATIWKKLPEEFKSDTDFARAIPHFCWTTANDVLDYCPQLRNDRNIWWQIVSTYNDGSLEYIISRYASPEIRADRTIMLRAGHRCEYVFRHVHSTLWQDPTFMENFLSCARIPLVYLPQQIQSHNTDLVIQLFPRCRQLYDSEIALAARNVPHQFWQNRTIALQWFASGGLFVDDCFPMEWKDDREIFLLIAANRHCALWPWSRPSQSLTSDKAFMLQAVEVNPFAYFLVSASLSKDFDILVAALRHCIVHSIRRGKHPKKEFLQDLQITVRNKLRSCNNYLNIVLPAISDELQGCNISILNQGLETSAAYVRLIADYLDVPMGKAAQKNLQRAFQTLCEILSSPY